MMKDYAIVVERILREHPDVRDDDQRLYVWICNEINPDILRLPFGKTFWFHDETGLPSYETITRQRRKLQEQHPELRGKKYQQRQGRQKEYIDKFGRKYS